MSGIRKITSIETQKKRRERYSIFLDNEFAFGIHQDVLLESGIAQGDEISQEKIDEILDLEACRNAKEKAIRLLAVRARSKKELHDRLSQAGFSQKAVEWTLCELDRLKLLNDAEFAVSFARSKMITKPVGNFLLRQELKFKGISETDIEKAVDEAYSENSESDLAHELAIKRKRVLSNVDELKAKKRVSDFLLRRGFNWDIVNDIIENWEQL